MDKIRNMLIGTLPAVVVIMETLTLEEKKKSYGTFET